MPKVAKGKTGRGNVHIIFKYDGRRVLAPRPNSYNEAMWTVRKRFPALAAGFSISFETDGLDVCEGQTAEIPEDLWEEIIPGINSLVVNAKPQEAIITADDGERHSKGSIKCIVAPSTPLWKVLEGAAQCIDNSCVGDWRMFFDDERMDTRPKISDTPLEDGDHVDIHPVQEGGKPVVYLFSPRSLEASIKLSLVPQWSLSVIYPVVPIKARTPDSNEEVAWRVHVHPNGELTELTTGLDVAYLFWEALTNPVISPPASPIDIQREVFDPNNAVLNALNSVVLSTDKITPYLDEALLALGLHTEARTSFITYWLPSILKHKNVALRFLPQDAYERAAPLDVSPQPDVVTRIFMLFKGVEDEVLGEWTAAQAKATQDISWWRDAVGVDLVRAMDASLFRVLEWGGMEVLH